MDFDGKYIHAFPAACAAASFSDAALGAFHLPAVHGIAVFMVDDVMAKINAAFACLSSAVALSNPGYYWSVGQYSIDRSWLYSGSTGELRDYRKCGAYSVRALAYLPRS